jgi:hypothetical protein
LVKEFDPTVAFVNEGEWDVVGGSPDALSVDAVIKSGRLGSTFVVVACRWYSGQCPAQRLTSPAPETLWQPGISLAARRWRWRPRLAVPRARAGSHRDDVAAGRTWMARIGA